MPFVRLIPVFCCLLAVVVPLPASSVGGGSEIGGERFGLSANLPRTGAGRVTATIAPDHVDVHYSLYRRVERDGTEHAGEALVDLIAGYERQSIEVVDVAYGHYGKKKGWSLNAHLRQRIPLGDADGRERMQRLIRARAAFARHVEGAEVPSTLKHREDRYGLGDERRRELRAALIDEVESDCRDLIAAAAELNGLEPGRIRCLPTFRREVLLTARLAETVWALDYRVDLAVGE